MISNQTCFLRSITLVLLSAAAPISHPQKFSVLYNFGRLAGPR